LLPDGHRPAGVDAQACGKLTVPCRPTRRSRFYGFSFGVALIGFVLLIMWRAPPLLVVVIGAVAGVALAQTH
jgi:hypothetical protein